jgi:hypothetical protein
MKKLFEISSEERQRILEMHETATKKNYLSEQAAQPVQQAKAGGTLINGVTYKLQGLTDKNIDKFLNGKYLVCDRFDTNINLKELGFGVECVQQDDKNPCCNLKTHLVKYLTALAKAYSTPEEFKKYPFSAYLNSASGKPFLILWKTKMKEANPTYNQTKPLGGPEFDKLVYNFVINDNLKNAGLPQIKQV